MELKTSFWGSFTREGRLKNQWVRALKDPDVASSLNRLRQVQQKLQHNPTIFAHLWMPFLDIFLDTTRASALTEADLTAATEMGNTLSGIPSVQLRPQEVWERVVKAYDARSEERQARALLTRIYNTPSTNADEKLRYARDLAGRGARGDEHLNIYIDHLKRVRSPAQEQAVLTILTSICAVNFDSDNVMLRRAGEVAQRLVETKTEVSGLQIALGLHALQIAQDSSKATVHFRAAFKANRKDRVALVGLLAALIRNEAYADIEVLSRNIKHEGLSMDELVSGLVSLSKTLNWLNSQMSTDLPLETIRNPERFKDLDLHKYVGDVVDLAIGRLYLLGGSAKQAAEVLLPLAERHPEQSRWGYYAAWAAMLTDNVGGVDRLYSASSKWVGRWTIACLLLDTDPTLAEKRQVYSYLTMAAKNLEIRVYAPIIEARVALARSSLPTMGTWNVSTNDLEGNLEALRTSLGYEFYRRNSENMARSIAHPLFRLLPLADKVMWRGLHALLAGDQMQGRTLLEEAAIKFGYRRAALTLAIHFLEQNKIGDARRFLEQASKGHNDVKIRLLRAYLDLFEERIESATGQFEKLVTQGEPRAYYALGNLYLHHAEEARKTGRSQQTRLYREQAAGAFSAALKMDRQSIPGDCEILSSCAAFVANPEGTRGSSTRIWHELERQAVPRRRAWIVWNAALAQIWYGKPPEVAAACQELLVLLQQGTHLQLSASEIETIARAVARTSHMVEDVDQSEALMKLLSYFSESSGLPAVKRFSQLVFTAAARKRYTKTSENRRGQAQQQLGRLAKNHHDNGSLALLAAYASLERHNVTGAVEALLNARPVDDFEEGLCNALADLLEGRTSSLEMLPAVPEDAEAEIPRGYHILATALMVAEGKLEQSHKAILALMREENNDVITILNIARLLPLLCAQARRGEVVPPELAQAVIKMSKVPGDIVRTVTVARCAAAIGHLEISCQLWEQALAKESNPASPLHHEYANFLCYLAVTAHRSGNDAEAASRLRQASSIVLTDGGGIYA